MKKLESGEVYGFGLEEPDVFLASFQGRAHTSDIRAMRTALEREARGRPNKLTVLVHVGHGATLGRTGRQALSEMMTAASPFTEAWAVVIAGEGFWVASARSVAGVVLGMARTSYPVHVAADVDSAVAWLSTRRNTPIPKTLREAIASLGPGQRKGEPIEETRAGVAQVRLTAHLTRDALVSALAPLTPRLERGETFCLIVDALDMTGYDVEARAYFVEWNGTHRGRVPATAVVIRNPLWRMVVQAMAVASRQRMTSFSSLADAESWIRDIARNPSADEKR